MKPFTFGQHFKNDKYYTFDKHGVTVMKPWPAIVAYRKTKCRAWKCVRPNLSFNEYDIPNKENLNQCYRCTLNETFRTDYQHECKPEPLISFLSFVPKEILSLINHVGSRQWHLLALFARCGEPAIDLFKSTPALAWMLASSWAFKKKPVSNHFRSIRALLNPGKSQLDILKWLDFPSSKSVIKVLRKVDLSEINISLFLNLRKLINENVSINSLRHIATIDLSIIGLLSACPNNYSCKFLVNYSKLDIRTRYKIKNLINDTVDNSLRQSHSFTDKHLNILLEIRQTGLPIQKLNKESLKRVFPWPPFELPDNCPEIEYIDDEDELLKESEIMHNCIDDQVESAYSQKIQFYRILGQERCVFSIEKVCQKDRFLVNEIKAVCNQTPSKNSMNILFDWIEKVNACNTGVRLDVQLQ